MGKGSKKLAWLLAFALLIVSMLPGGATVSAKELAQKVSNEVNGNIMLSNHSIVEDDSMRAGRKASWDLQPVLDSDGQGDAEVQGYQFVTLTGIVDNGSSVLLRNRTGRIQLIGGMVNDDNIRYKWVSNDENIIKITSTDTNMPMINITAGDRAGLATIAVTVEKMDDAGNNVMKSETALLQIEVRFLISEDFPSQTAPDTSVFMTRLKDSDERKSLIMNHGSVVSVGKAEDASGTSLIKPIFGDLTKASWSSSNEDVVRYDEEHGRIQAVGAGSARLTVSYTVGADTYTEELAVYVKPQLAVPDADDPSKTVVVGGVNAQGGVNNPSGTVTVENGDKIGVSVLSAARPELAVGDKIVWVISKGEGGNAELVRDSLGNTGENPAAANLVYIRSEKAYRLDAKAGIYNIQFYVKGTYVNFEDSQGPQSVSARVGGINLITGVKCIYGDMEITLNIGSSFNLADALNMPLKMLRNNFSSRPTAPQDGWDNFIGWDSDNLTITAKSLSTRDVKVTVRPNNGLEIADIPGMRSKDPITITIKVVDTFSLNISATQLAVGATLDLYGMIGSETLAEDSQFHWTIDNERYLSFEPKLEEGREGPIATVKANARPVDKENPVTVRLAWTDDRSITWVATCKITIMDSPTEFQITKETLSLEAGDTDTLETNLSGSQNILWISSDPSIVTVEPNTGNTTAKVTAADKTGSVVIVALNKANDAYATCIVTVHSLITSVKIDKSPSYTTTVGTPFVFMGVTYEPANATVTEMIWESTDEQVATVDDKGMVTVKGVGKTTIKVRPVKADLSSGDVYDECVLNVTSVEPAKSFTWNRDNWNFNNSNNYFPSGRYANQINSTYLNKLKQNLTNTEYRAVFNTVSGWLYDTWGGSCYGMASTSFLGMNNLLAYSEYKGGAENLYQLDSPVNDKNISSLVTYYQMLQVKDAIQRQYRTVPYKTNKDNINRIISLLDENPLVLVGFEKKRWGGHAILAYGYEYGDYTWNGVSYDGCIKICDPNSSKQYQEEFNIYFNTATYDWTIPVYCSGSNGPITSRAGAVFNYIGADVNEINDGGYIGKSRGKDSALGYVARIDINTDAEAEDYSVVKVEKSNGEYVEKDDGLDDIKERYSYILAGESEGTAGFDLFDSDSAYKVTQNGEKEMALSINYGDCYLESTVSDGESIIFDKNGYVEMSGEAGDFNISMTFNEDHPTKWSGVEISGSGSEEISVAKGDEGYIISGDTLKNVDIELEHRDESVQTSFSTEYGTACICEIDEDTVGVKVDTDGNGTYDTVIKTSGGEKDPSSTSSPSPTTPSTSSPAPTTPSAPAAPFQPPVIIPSSSPSAVPTISPATEVPKNTATPEPTKTPEVTVSPEPVETPTPTVQPGNGPDTENEDGNSGKALKKGAKVTDKKTQAVYKVTGTGKNKTVEYVKSTKGNASRVTIPAKVKLKGHSYKVASVAPGAFKNNSKLNYITIGKNVKKIGKKAFYGCKRLRYIDVKSKKLTAKSIGKQAFGRGYKLPRVKSAKNVWKRYARIMPAKGLSKKAVFIINPARLVK